MRREEKSLVVPEFACRSTVWRYTVGYGHTTTDKEAHEQHPALMPEELAQDLIRSFAKPGELVFDPMAGLGTTCKMAMLNGHPFLGFELNEQYCHDARERLNKYRNDTSPKAG
jgi:DNA modification methylase